jgi:hypothetical protein
MEVKDMKSLMSIPYFKSIVSNNQELSDPKNELLKREVSELLEQMKKDKEKSASGSGRGR